MSFYFATFVAQPLFIRFMAFFGFGRFFGLGGSSSSALVYDIVMGLLFSTGTLYLCSVSYPITSPPNATRSPSAAPSLQLPLIYIGIDGSVLLDFTQKFITQLSRLLFFSTTCPPSSSSPTISFSYMLNPAPSQTILSDSSDLLNDFCPSSASQPLSAGMSFIRHVLGHWTIDKIGSSGFVFARPISGLAYHAFFPCISKFAIDHSLSALMGVAIELIFLTVVMLTLFHVVPYLSDSSIPDLTRKIRERNLPHEDEKRIIDAVRSLVPTVCVLGAFVVIALTVIENSLRLSFIPAFSSAPPFFLSPRFPVFHGRRTNMFRSECRAGSHCDP
jgi:hypothetical protein